MTTAITRYEKCSKEMPVANLELHRLRCCVDRRTYPASPDARGGLPLQNSDPDGHSCSRALISAPTGTTAASAPNDPRKEEPLDHACQLEGSVMSGCSEAVTADQMDDKTMGGTVQSTGADTGPLSKQMVPANEGKQQKPEPLSYTHAGEITFQCTSAMNGRQLEVVADSCGTLGELAVITQSKLCLPVDDEKVVMFVGDNAQVIYNGLKLQRLADTGSTCMSFVLLPREVAAHAQFKVRIDFLVSEVERMSISLQPCLTKQEFGETLARKAYKGMREHGRSVNGRIRLSCRVGKSQISSEFEDSFMLCSGIIQVEDLITDHVAERGVQPGRYTVIQQQQIFGNVRFKVETYQTCGSIMLSIGGRAGYCWSTEDEFADFWKSMSDYRVAAFCAGYFVEVIDMLDGSKYPRAEVPLTAENFRLLAHGM
eukprot:TRINITY_DN24845_c0_g2_i1.p1 TRINITY_DN24845_c0_g2~~TRINITY_DN24845_c0_g2_i1.p1  ORF type:complete len:427 (+),score=78.38 TRINITY_DN24845_c0_g2_i1:42-1322(+)